MELTMLEGKIHRATVTQAEPDYIGSITIDATLMEAAGMHEYEYVQVADVENGNRLETYIIEGDRDSGIICLNGAAAKLVNCGDHVIIMTYVSLTPEELSTHKPKVCFVDDNNKVLRITNYEKHGKLKL